MKRILVCLGLILVVAVWVFADTGEVDQYQLNDDPDSRSTAAFRGFKTFRLVDGPIVLPPGSEYISESIRTDGYEVFGSRMLLDDPNIPGCGDDKQVQWRWLEEGDYFDSLGDWRHGTGSGAPPCTINSVCYTAGPMARIHISVPLTSENIHCIEPLVLNSIDILLKQ